MPQYLRVLYQFDAADDVELSVAKDTVVRMCDQQADSPGWVQVETVHGEKREGFVPEGYVEVITAEEAGMMDELTMQQMAARTVPMEQQQQQQQPISHQSTGLPPVATTPTPSQAVGSADHRNGSATTQSNTPTPVIPPQNPVSVGERSIDLESKIDTPPMDLPRMKRDSLSMQSNTTGLVESFMKNEVYFRSLMKQRQETLLKIDGCINETAQEIAACKNKNSLLSKKIRELDNMIEEDRAKWRSRIDEEKKLLLSQANTNLGLSHSIGRVK
eukprot:TRINITY_DN10583_c0_g2_i1.p2 TRINITY_DN10583_c0_g2~~TRINITY_DN10583_c0_g2_i1.p2  ORF type:complete len:290 (+),score=59.44 TRINITY_DN10583_c0_g2_i1:54-872(+)